MKRRAKDGYVLVLALTMLVILGLMATTLTFTSISTGRATGDERGRTQAFYASQSGLERVSRRMSERAKTLAATTVPAAVEQLKTALAAPITGNTGQGTFSVVLQDVSPGVLRVKSTGKDVSGNASRILSTDVQLVLVAGNAGAYAPAALITTGDVKDNGAAPVAGFQYPGSPSRTFTCTPATPAGAVNSPCKVVQGGLNTYVLDTPVSSTNPPPVGGQTFTDSGGRSYVVQNVVTDSATAPTKATVTLAAMNENPSIANSPQPMNSSLLSIPNITLSRKNTSSITAPTGSDLANPSNNTSGVCNPTLYGCTTYSFPPSNLFQLIFGTTKDVFKQRMSDLGNLLGGSGLPAYNSTSCSTRSIMWITVSSNFDNECVTTPATPKILIVDASQSSIANFQVKTSSVFYGIIYVITNDKVSLAGNGTFKGSVISEAGIDADPDNNGLSTVVGNGSAACPEVPSGNGNSNKPAKICYDPGIMSLLDTITSQQLAQINVSKLPVTWKEYAQ